jgi:hypothetical protein
LKKQILLQAQFIVLVSGRVSTSDRFGQRRTLPNAHGPLQSAEHCKGVTVYCHMWQNSVLVRFESHSFFFSVSTFTGNGAQTAGNILTSSEF